MPALLLCAVLLPPGAADMIDTENFNLIPGKEFGYAMLRMPW